MPKPKPKPKRRRPQVRPLTVMLRVSVEFADYLTERAKRQGISRSELTRQMAAALTALQPAGGANAATE